MSSGLSQAWRSWMRAKAVGVLAALALAVGIGASTAIYTVVNAVMLRPLPYQGSERFVALYGSNARDPNERASHRFPHLIEYQQRTRSFEVFGWFTRRNFNLTAPGVPRHVSGAAVTPSLAHHLGVTPMLGQWFGDESGAVISYGLWRDLGSDPALVGKGLTLNGRTYTLTGVMPAAFRLPVAGAGGGRVESDVWILLDPLGRGQERLDGSYFCYARLKPGVTIAQAQADVKRVAADIAREDTSLGPAYTGRLDDLQADAVESIRPTLLLLMGAAGLLLLITCANVAGLLLTRAVARARETAVRVAIGASHWTLALQYFTEGLFVSVVGAAAGAAASILLVRVMVAIAAEHVPRAEEIGIDWRALLFTFGVACVTSVLSSLAPLWQATRTQPTEVLRDGVRVLADARSRRLSRGLVIAEIAVAFALLVSSAVLLGRLAGLTRAWPGFEPKELLTFQLVVSESAAQESASSVSATRAAYHQQLLDAISTVPGVSSAAIVNQLPFSCCFGSAIYPEGVRAESHAGQRNALLTVSPAYLQTMRIPLQRGRFLTERDTGRTPLNVVVNEAASRAFWPDRDPVGAFGHFGTPDGARFQVVGIVGDVRNDGLGKATVPEIYLSSTILPVNPIWFLVRSPVSPERLIPDLRRVVQRIEPAQPLHRMATMQELAQQSVARERVGSLTVTFFALSALLMATLGVYGVVAYTVRQGTAEIGTRMALGAVGRDVLWLFVRSGLRMAAYGVGLGVVLVVSGTWLLARLFDVRELGWLPFVVSLVVMTTIVTIASLVPAWRASLLSPSVAIRNDRGFT